MMTLYKRRHLFKPVDSGRKLTPHLSRQPIQKEGCFIATYDSPDNHHKMLQSAPFCQLKDAAKVMADVSMRDLYKDSERSRRMIVDALGISMDFSRQLMSSRVLDLLLDLARDRDVAQKISRMFLGEKINETEGRAVLHVALRAPVDQVITVDGSNVVVEVHDVLSRIKRFSEDVRNGKHVGFTGKPLKDVICIGIGGSFLGPEFVFEALRTYSDAVTAAAGRRLHFLANVDPDDVVRALTGFHPETTLVIVISKTFTTAETMLNARTVKNWLVQALGDEKAIGQHYVACSTNIEATTKFGIEPKNVFGFWDWVGGRFSVTSAVGVLPLALQYGFPIVQEFLSGAYAMDRHFNTATLDQNLPVLMALIAHWNRNHMGHAAIAILPYSQALLRFPAHVQQLNMESNGKGTTIDGHSITYPTGPIIFGEPGTNGQHSFYQLLHQGEVVPAEFIGFIKSPNDVLLPGEAVSNHDELMSNFFAQPDALAFGKTLEEVKAEGVPQALWAHKVFPGNRPSVQLLFPECNPTTIGMLLALYEHRTAVEGFLLGINSFDQWGVEYGKQLAKDVRQYFAAARSAEASQCDALKKAFNSPTQAMLTRYLTKGT